MKRFKNILCVIDRHAAEQFALERAVTLAENNQACVSVVTVIEPIRHSISSSRQANEPASSQAGWNDAGMRYLDALIQPYRERVAIDAKALSGITFLEIVQEVLRNDHDLVIKCPESPDWLERLFSGDDMHLLRKCPCPVWMVKPGNPSYRNILAAVDVDYIYPTRELETRQALNAMVMDLAGSLAMSEFAQLHVVHAWEAVAENALRHSAFLRTSDAEVEAYVEQVRRDHARSLDALMDDVAARLGQDAIDYLKPRLHMPKGAASKLIPELARELRVDCIVMGTVARTGIRGFIMGNTAETILGQIDCSVLAIKPPGFVTPVKLED